MIREIILFIVMVYIIISLIEMISKLFWIMQYYHIGINIYNRKIPKRNEQLCELFARVKEEINNNELLRISFHISDKKRSILFRGAFINCPFRINSILHGRIDEETDHYRIIGYVGYSQILIGLAFMAILIELLISWIITGNSNFLLGILFITGLFVSVWIFNGINFLLVKRYYDNI